MTEETPDYVERPFASQVHNSQRSTAVEGLDENTRQGMRGKLIESILQIVATVFTGGIIPIGGIGSALGALVNWVEAILPDQIMDPIRQLVDILSDVPIIGGWIEWFADLIGLTAEQAEIANTPNNPAIVDQGNQIDAINDILANSGDLTASFFDKMDRDPLGSDWAVVSGAVEMRKTSGQFDYVKCINTTPTRLRLDIRQFSSAQQYAAMRIRQVENGDNVLAIMANSAFTQYCGVRTNDQAGGTDNYLQIVTTSNVEQDRFDLNRAWKVNDVIGIGYEIASENYVAYLNDEPVCEFHDPGAVIVPIIASGAFLQVLLNANNGFSGNRGAGVDNFVARDWT